MKKAHAQIRNTHTHLHMHTHTHRHTHSYTHTVSGVGGGGAPALGPGGMGSSLAAPKAGKNDLEGFLAPESGAEPPEKKPPPPFLSDLSCVVEHAAGNGACYNE